MTECSIRRTMPQWCAAVLYVCMAAAATCPALAKTDWNKLLSQPDTWYASPEAQAVARNVLIRQHDNGGWNKNYDAIKPLTPDEEAKLKAKRDDRESTIDNAATTSEMRLLAAVYSQTHQPELKQAFDRGLNYLLEAQYDNGGWPQYYPLRKGYYECITFNDDAMVRVMRLMQKLATAQGPFAFVSSPQREAAQHAFDRGIQCILDTQVIVDGKRTVWCAQHDAKTLKPAKARIYEHISLSGMETVAIVELLMSVENPSPQVIEAVQSAVAWLDEVKVVGLDLVNIEDAEGNKDRVVRPDPQAKPMWARFYEIGTNRPIFSGRDGVIHYEMAEVERERRAGYLWYSRRANKLLESEYPAWQQQWAPERNVLANGA